MPDLLGEDRPRDKDLLACLADLYSEIAFSKRRTGVLPPKKFVQRLKKDNELFRSYMHQDAGGRCLFCLSRLLSPVIPRALIKNKLQATQIAQPSLIASGRVSLQRAARAPSGAAVGGAKRRGRQSGGESLTTRPGRPPLPAAAAADARRRRAD